jgi:hypothetical protein
MNRPASISLSATCAAVLLVTSVVDARVAGAAPGTVALSWGACSPIVQDVTATSGVLRLFVTVTGLDDTHIGYQVRFLLSDASADVPDAWRFDEAGCQPAGAVTMVSDFDIFPSDCPLLGKGSVANEIRDVRLMPAGTSLPTTVLRGAYGGTYSMRGPADPATHYRLVEIRFDHSASVVGDGVPGVLCGGLETPVCIALLTGVQEPGVGSTSYFRGSDGEEVPFENAGANWVTVNGMGGCPSVSSSRSTWGQIKGVYRR